VVILDFLSTFHYDTHFLLFGVYFVLPYIHEKNELYDNQQ
jgi:hypothetical protein